MFKLERPGFAEIGRISGRDKLRKPQPASPHAFDIELRVLFLWLRREC
jgi:hypothetical protein